MKASPGLLAPIAALLVAAVLLLATPSFAQAPAAVNVSPRAAEIMIINAERALNFTKARLEFAESLGNVTIPDTVKEAINEAEALLAEARTAYEEGKYSEAFTLALEATRKARTALRELCLCCPEVRAEVNATLLRLRLRHKIRLLQEEALMLRRMAKRAATVTGNKTIIVEVEKALEEASEKVKKALEALKEGNVTLARELLHEAHEMLREKARATVKEAAVQVCVRRMEMWREEIKERIEIAIERLEELKRVLEEKGANETVIEAIEVRIEKLKEILEELDEVNFTAPPIRLALALNLRLHPLLVRIKWALHPHILAKIAARVRAGHIHPAEVLKELRKHGIPVAPGPRRRHSGKVPPSPTLTPTIPPAVAGPKGRPVILPPENVEVKAEPLNETAVKVEVTIIPPVGFNVSVGPAKVGLGHISVPVRLIPVNATLSVVTPYHETLIVKTPEPGVYVVSITHAGRVVKSIEVNVKPGQASHEVSVTVTPGAPSGSAKQQ